MSTDSFIPTPYVMKKNILFSSCLMALLCACNSGAQNRTQATNDEATRQAVVQRVTDIYTTVCQAYPSDHGFDAEGETFTLNIPNLDSLYCSTAWNQLLADVAEVDSQDPDNIGFFDFDYWIMGQDWDDLHFDHVTVDEIRGDTVYVSLDWYNCGSCSTIELQLVNEDGEWRIDDIDGLRQSMKDYIRESTQGSE